LQDWLVLKATYSSLNHQNAHLLFQSAKLCPHLTFGLPWSDTLMGIYCTIDSHDFMAILNFLQKVYTKTCNLVIPSAFFLSWRFWILVSEGIKSQASMRRTRSFLHLDGDGTDLIFNSLATFVSSLTFPAFPLCELQHNVVDGSIFPCCLNMNFNKLQITCKRPQLIDA
jgi:hypothetical protein